MQAEGTVVKHDYPTLGLEVECDQTFIFIVVTIQMVNFSRFLLFLYQYKQQILQQLEKVNLADLCSDIMLHCNPCISPHPLPASEVELATIPLIVA